MVKWISGVNPKEVANRIEAIKAITPEGKVTFQGFEFREYKTLLYSMVEFPEGTPRIERERIVNQAIFRAGEKGEISANAVLKEIKKLESNYQRLQIKNCHLITSISIKRTIPLKSLVVDGCNISFPLNLPSFSGKERGKVFERARHILTAPLPNNYKNARVFVKAKSLHEAANHALNTLDFVRGIWNFSFNRSANLRMSYGKRVPVNKIILGPIHSLHDTKGKWSTDTLWYEPEYREPIKPIGQRNSINGMYKLLSNVRNCLKRINYSDKLKDAIIRYSRALDITNWEDSFLRLWAILEHLTGTLNAPYKITIKRASFFFQGQDREYHRQILNHLRNYRNRVVHVGTDDEDIETYMYQLKRYVEVLLEFHLGNKFGFNTLSEAADALDLPNESSQLNSKIKLLRNVKTFFK